MKKFLLVFSMTALLACFLAISVFATTGNNETVTLNDGTSLSLWAEDGSGLIWYIRGTDSDTGEKIYASVSNLQQDSTLGKTYVKYTAGSSANSITGISIVDENGTEYDIKQIVVANLKYSEEKPLCLPKKNSGFNSFGDKLFYSCTKLEYILVPDALIKVPANCFNGCSSLEEFDASNTSLEFFGGASFQNCTSLTYVSFPACLGGFSGQNMFNGCTKLKEANGINKVFENTAKNGGIIPNGLFKNCSSLETDIVLYEGITGIGEYAFMGCTKIGSFKNLVVPNTVTALGRSSFNGCTQVESIKLGASLASNSTGYWVADCKNLKQIYIPATLSGFANDVVRSVSKQCVFYFTGTEKQAQDFKTSSSGTNNSILKNATVISLSEFNVLTEKSGSYFVYDYPLCDAFYNGAHITAETIVYESYDAVGAKKDECTIDGCCYFTKEDAAPLFTCIGYSASTYGSSGGIAIGYIVNVEAVEEYTTVTNKTLKYGVFVVAKDKLGENDIFNEDGTAASGVVNAEVSSQGYAAFMLKVVGFANEHKDAKLTMGSYVAVTSGDITEYSIMQNTSKGELVGKYYFTSYNEIINGK